MQKVAIFGCGWLGKPLARALQEKFDVKCFSRETTADDDAFWQSDTMIIAIHTKENYLATLQKVAALTKPEANIVLMSSTSVYREFECDVDEQSFITHNSLIKEAEELLLGLRERVLVLRLGGLMGEDRVAGRWKSALAFQDGYVNYIHQEDVIAIITTMLERGINEGIYNLVAPLHPTRLEIHQKNAQKFGVDVGAFEGFTKRRVLSNKVIQELGYSFRYPNPLEFWD